MTERLYYEDSRLIEFEARVTESSADGRKVYLDRTAFYPASGGQPSDRGLLGGIRVEDVLDEEDRVAHLLAAPLTEQSVRGNVDWPRRFDHMQQHSGQHLLSAVIEEMYGYQTVSFHLGAEVSTIDVGTASMSAEQVVAAESKVNELVVENRPVGVEFQHASEGPDLRKSSDRAGMLRIVTIQDLDRSACGGTHVRATGEIGPVLLRKQEKIRGNVRIEFLCGNRALRRARADFDSLTAVARQFSCPLDDAPAMVTAQFERIRALEKEIRAANTDLARYRGRELYENTALSADGLRRHRMEVASGAISEDLRWLAQSFTSLPKALFLAVIQDPPAVLLAVSADSGLHAGNLVKAALAAAGGRGGGGATIAQGSLPSASALETLLEQLQKSGV